MSDRLYLSYWVRGFAGPGILAHFEKVLRAFPYSSMSPAGPLLRIYALEFSEPPVLEQRFDWNADIESVLEAAREFENPDCCYLLETHWNLWKRLPAPSPADWCENAAGNGVGEADTGVFLERESGWSLAPSPVALVCLGPLFQNELGDHLRVECGSDRDFLPPGATGKAGKVRSNIKSVLRLANELDGILPVEKRLLWTESGENFAEKLRAALG